MARSDAILSDALTLTDTERAEIALRLLDSIEAPDPLAELDDADWAEEIARRAERVAAGASQGAPWAVVKARLERQTGG